MTQIYIKQNIHKHWTQNFRRISPFGIFNQQQTDGSTKVMINDGFGDCSRSAAYNFKKSENAGTYATKTD